MSVLKKKFTYYSTYVYTIWLMLEHQNKVTGEEQIIFQEGNLLI